MVSKAQDRAGAANRRIAAGCVLLAALAAAQASRAQDRPGTELTTITVRVLDSAGTPVSGVDVEVSITRGDGSKDRRLGTSDEDGRASFDDVRADCIDFRASALPASGRVDGKPRECGEGFEVFIVLPPPAAGAAPPPAAAGGIDSDPKAEPGPPPPETPPATPETEPGAGEESAEPGEADEPAEWPKGPIAIGARAGIGLCQEWFYRPGPADQKCADDVSIALDLEIDGGWHLTEWLAVGPRLGYGLYSSTETIEVKEDPGSTSQIDLVGNVPLGEAVVEATNHRLHWGLGARALWMPGRLVLGADLMPLALVHHSTRIQGGDNREYTEFAVSAGLLAGIRMDRSWWIGVQVRFFQPLPWIESQRFLPGTLALGMTIGYRFDSMGRPREEPEAAGRKPEVEPEDPEMERRRHFIELQQERGGF